MKKLLAVLIVMCVFCTSAFADSQDQNTMTGTMSGDVNLGGGDVNTDSGDVNLGGGDVRTEGGDTRLDGGRLITGGGHIYSQGAHLYSGGGSLVTNGGNISSQGGNINTQGGNINANGGTVWTDKIVNSNDVSSPSISTNSISAKSGSTVKISANMDAQGNRISNVYQIAVQDKTPNADNVLASKYYVDLAIKDRMYLYGKKHTYDQCHRIGGSVEGYGSRVFCKVSSCPSGWTRYGDINITEVTKQDAVSGNTGCMTDNHSMFKSGVRERCPIYNVHGYVAYWVYARIVAVACY
jgi:hypothetical protein